jgi:hypothetical protein
VAVHWRFTISIRINFCKPFSWRGVPNFQTTAPNTGTYWPNSVRTLQSSVIARWLGLCYKGSV